MRLLVFLLLAASASAQPSPGDPAPDPGVETFLNAPDTAWGEMRGRAVVMDLWTTWCAPCIATMPHVAALADSFALRPVQFLSVSDEPLGTVEAFADGRRMAGWIGVDEDGSSRDRYGINGIPQVVLVYPDGRLAGITHPDEVNAQTIEALIAGEPLGLPVPEPRVSIQELMARARAGRPDIASGPVMVSIRWSDATDDADRPRGSSGNWREGWMTATHAELRMLLSTAWNMRDDDSEDRMPTPFAFWGVMDGPDSLLTRELDLTYNQPGMSREDQSALLLNLFRDSLGVDVTFETRPTDGFALRRHPDRPLTLTDDAGPSRQSSSDGIYSIRGATPSALASALGMWTEREVTDETGLGGTYRLLLETENADDPEVQSERLRAALLERTGLELVPVTQETEWLVVRERP